MRRYPTTPVWLKLSVAAVLCGALGWWALDRADRVGNEHRLAAIASQIAGRDVDVRCPGPIGRVLGRADTIKGSVRFDAEGRPANDTRLRATSCAELDALAEGRRGKELACTERAGILCGRHASELAMAVDVITHEAWHLRGLQDEGRTECNALQTMAATAMRSARPRGRPPRSPAASSPRASRGCPTTTAPSTARTAGRSTSAPTTRTFPRSPSKNRRRVRRIRACRLL